MYVWHVVGLPGNEGVATWISSQHRQTPRSPHENPEHKMVTQALNYFQALFGRRIYRGEWGGEVRAG